MLTRRRVLGAWPLLALAVGRSGDARAQATPQPPRILSGDDRVPVEPLRLPRDHAAHPDSRVEWWNLKGELLPAKGKALGFHLSFIRFQVESAAESKSRFAPRYVVAARASLSDLDKGEQWHDQRVARLGFGLAEMAQDEMQIRLHDWSLRRQMQGEGGVFLGGIAAKDFQLDLRCVPTQSPLQHGDGGVLHRDPLLGYPTRYYSLVQLKTQGQVSLRGVQHAVTGLAWMDHGWGRRMLSPDAVGSDWMCMNLRDGGALVVFRMRRSDGTAAFAGAARRLPGRPDQIFRSEEVKMTPGQTWRSPANGAQYPVSWEIELAGTRYSVQARMHAQEVDGGNEIGDAFWEGLSDLKDAQGRLIGTGYLEMTGYAAELAW